MINQELARTKELLLEGWGRRRIAKDLGITEWKARHYIELALQTTAISKTKQNKPESPRQERVYSEKILKNSTSGKPRIKVVETNFDHASKAIDADIPSKLRTRATSLKVAAIGDVHYPYEDANAVKIAQAYLADYKPDVLVFIGDIADFYSVSRYDKSPSKKLDIQYELDYTLEKLNEWVELLPDCDFKFITGNHEQRLARMINSNAAALANMRSLKFGEALDLESIGIELIPENKDLFIGNLMFIHGSSVRKAPGASVKSHFDQYGCSIIMGHVHRLSVSWTRNKFGQHAMIENGTLCDFDCEFVRFPNWCHGFSTMEFDGDDFNVKQHQITDYKLLADGKVYTL